MPLSKAAHKKKLTDRLAEWRAWASGTENYQRKILCPLLLISVCRRWWHKLSCCERLFNCFCAKWVFNSNCPLNGINLHYFLNPSVLHSVKCSMWELFEVLWNLWSSDSQDNETDRHKQAERDKTHLFNGDWRFSPAINIGIHTQRPHKHRNSTAATGQSISKSQPIHPLRGSELLYIHTYHS